MRWFGLTLFPTFVCNFSCPFCAFSADLNQHRDELSLEEIDRISRRLGSVLVLHIGGGEPFIRQDLPEVIQSVWRHTGVRRVEIPTNGWSAERIGKQVQRIFDLCPRLRLNVRVSLDGVGDAHDRVRARSGSYKTAVETLNTLREMTGSQPSLSTGVCQTVTAHNQETALSTYRTIRDNLRPDSVVLNVCREGSQEDRAALAVLPARYEEVTREMNRDVERGVWWNYPRSNWIQSAFLNSLHSTVWRLISRELTSDRPAIRCSAGAGRSLIVYSTGDVALCELQPVVGNLREHDYSIEALLETPKARDALRTLSTCTRRHEVCWHTSVADPRLNPWIALQVAGRTARLAASRAFDRISRRVS